MPHTPLAKAAGPIAIIAGTLVVATRLVVMLTTPADLASLQAAVLTPLYAINAVASVVAFAILALALVAIYEREAHAAGWLGVIGLGAALTGTVFMAGDWWYEAFAVPWMADVAPVVFETGAGGRLLVGGLTSFALFSFGWALFGAASIRARAFPRAISVAILVGGLVAGIPISGAYLYGSLIFGLAIASLGAWLLRPAVRRYGTGALQVSSRCIAVLAVAGAVAVAVAGCQSAGSLSGRTWQWTAGPVADAAGGPVAADPDAYTIEFLGDGTVSVRADCTTLSGTYAVGVPLDLTITVAAPAQDTCESSLDRVYLESLRRISSFSTDNGELRLYFADNAGAMQFTSLGS
jgi:heat shock protein HslJ